MEDSEWPWLVQLGEAGVHAVDRYHMHLDHELGHELWEYQTPALAGCSITYMYTVALNVSARLPTVDLRVPT